MSIRAPSRFQAGPRTQISHSANLFRDLLLCILPQGGKEVDYEVNSLFPSLGTIKAGGVQNRRRTHWKAWKARINSVAISQGHGFKEKLEPDVHKCHERRSCIPFGFAPFAFYYARQRT